MKKTTIHIRVSEEMKEEIKQEAVKLTHKLRVKITVSSFINWLWEKYKRDQKGE